ncbi:hypothetical protein RND81_08G007500 [Saponaria officinalis]|uniref:Pentatricopeptide repeat-containing protein n=1 Tax=Saponaria officinalis TaxID=3572 RepID=A0AAW1J2A3_SAPOF
MWKSRVVLILRQTRRAFNVEITYYPFVQSRAIATTRCFNPSITSIVIPEYANYFGFSRAFCCVRGTDFVDDDECGVTSDADILHKIVSENAGFDKNMEKALEKAEIGLSTELVVEILRRLRFEERVAFRFFMWAARQENYRHEYNVYSEMIDILSSTKVRSKQFRIVCDVLDYMKRNDKKSVPIEVVLTILRKYTEKYLTETLKCSGKKKTRFRVKKQPEINAFNLLLDSLCKCGLVDDAEILFKKMRSKVSPDANTFSTLFFGWCRVINPKRGMKVLEEMTSAGFDADSFMYSSAIDTFCKAGMVDKAVELFEFIKSRNSAVAPPTANTYAIMVLALVKNDRIEDGFRAVEDMMRSGCLPDVSTYKKLIEEMCVAGKVEEAYRLSEEMTKKGYPRDIVTYNCFLKVLCENKRSDEGLRLYNKMVDVGCMPSVHSFNMMLEMFFGMSDLDGAFYTWDEMDKKRCERDANTYCVMIEGLFDNDKVEDACSLLEDVVNKGIKLPYRKFDLFLMHLSKIGDLRGIQCLSEHMRTFYNPSMARRFSLNQKRMSLSLRG